MDARDSIISYIDSKIAKLQARAKKEDRPGWATARHDARTLSILRDEIVNEFDVGEAKDG